MLLHRPTLPISCWGPIRGGHSPGTPPVPHLFGGGCPWCCIRALLCALQTAGGFVLWAGEKRGAGGKGGAGSTPCPPPSTPKKENPLKTSLKKKRQFWESPCHCTPKRGYVPPPRPHPREVCLGQPSRPHHAPQSVSWEASREGQQHPWVMPQGT